MFNALLLKYRINRLTVEFKFDMERARLTSWGRGVNKASRLVGSSMCVTQSQCYVSKVIDSFLVNIMLLIKIMATKTKRLKKY